MRKLAATIALSGTLVSGSPTLAQPHEATELHRSGPVPAPSYDALFMSDVGAPDWSNGWGIRIDADPRSSDRYIAVGPDGAIQKGQVTLSGATSLKLKHAAATPGGTIVVAGYAITGNRSAQYFIARVGDEGRLAASIDTGPFAPMCICAADDESVWALGSELNADELGEDYALVRKFKFGEGLVGKALHASSFPEDKNPYMVINPWFAGWSNSAWLRCNSAHAYVYSNLTDELIEIDAKSFAVSRWHADSTLVGGKKVVGLGVTAGGVILGNLMSPEDRNFKGVHEIFVLQKAERQDSARWQPVAAAAYDSDQKAIPASRGYRVLGTDGEQLLVEPLGADLGRHAATWMRVDLSQLPAASDR